jgi:hypothetical protein
VRLRAVLAVFAALTTLAAVGGYFVIHNLSGGLPLHLPTQQCVVTAGGGKATLEPEQMANAATIAAVGIRRGVPTEAIVVALATASQESKLQNVSGGDRDSVGLFQQRPSQGWGTPEQLIDPRYATKKFYDALLKVKGWQQLTVAEAAQAVQRSADGSAYERWENQSRTLATALSGDATGAVGCEIVDAPTQRGTAAAAALADGLAADWGQVPTVNQSGIVGLALTVSLPRSGWQYAHWLVSHAADQNIRSVRYGDQVWTSKAASWGKSDSPSTDHVIAEVYG